MDAMVEEIGTLGNWLLGQLRPTGAQSTSAGLSAEQIVRDQLFTMLSNQYERAREAGVSVFTLRRIDDSMPPLLSRVHSAPGPAPAGPVTPPDAVVEGGPGGQGRKVAPIDHDGGAARVALDLAAPRAL